MTRIIISQIVLFSFFQPPVLFSQDITECRKVIQLTIESINTRSAEKLEGYLAEDFTMAGQQGEIAKLVLKQLFAQLNDSVKSSIELTQNRHEDGLEIKCNIEYYNGGMKEASFLFNSKSFLKELNLIKLTVKTIKGDAAIKKPDQPFVQIPFILSHNLITVKVLFNGEEKNFILDSGSPKVILNSKYLNLNRDSINKRSISSTQGVEGNISGMDIQKIQELSLGGIKLSKQEVLTLDLSHIEKELDTQIFGLIGYEFIKEYDVLFDYLEQKITLIDPEYYPDYYKNQLSKCQLKVNSIQMKKHIPVVEANINGITIKFGIDCGAESNLIDNDLFPKLKHGVKKMDSDELIGVANKTQKVKSGQLRKMVIGNKEFQNIYSVFSDMPHLSEGYDIEIDGLLGFPILSRQKTLLSFARKELVFID